jgi:excisionase family DNA binding protein
MWSNKAVNLADSLDGRTSALTVSDIAELLNISERQVYKLAAENGIPSFKIGGSVRFDPAAFAAWLRHKMGPASVDANGRQRARRA